MGSGVEGRISSNSKHNPLKSSRRRRFAVQLKAKDVLIYVRGYLMNAQGGNLTSWPDDHQGSFFLCNTSAWQMPLATIRWARIGHPLYIHHKSLKSFKTSQKRTGNIPESSSGDGFSFRFRGPGVGARPRPKIRGGRLSSRRNGSFRKKNVALV